jgi:predicted amidohydrolase YtcJ
VLAGASLILVGGRVACPITPGAFAEAVAVSGDRIVAVGTNHDVASFAGPSTRVISLRRRLVIPAFGDAHIHAVSGGLESLRCDLLGQRTRRGCLDKIFEYAASLPPDGWVLGGGWAMEAFPGGLPAASDLDAVCGGRPAFLPNREHHSAWVNTVALERAGVDAASPDPADGRIERDGKGAPTGVLHDGAIRQVARIVPRPSPAELADGLRVAQRRLHALGITHWQDACVGDAVELGITDSYDVYRSAAADGWLTGRVVGALWWDRTRGVEQLPELLGRREAAAGSAFRATTVKLMLDGICETFTAAMSRAYLGPPGAGGTHRGKLFIEPEAAAAAVGALDAEGFQVHFHAIGDRAVSTALDTLAGLPPERRGAGRHHLAHLQFIAPRDLDRFAPLGAIANFQPLWACHEPQMQDLTVPFVGPDRAGWQYSIASLARRGVPLAFGSDWPVSSPDPLQEIHVAVNRTLSRRLGHAGHDECETPFRPAEALGVAGAVDAFSRGVAYVNGDEAILGAIEPGRRADLVVLDRDIFSIPAREIGDTSVSLTIAGGTVVHGDE